MAKTNYSLLTPLKALYQKDVVKTPFSYKFLISFVVLLSVIIAILSGFKAVIIQESFLKNIMLVFIGLPVLLFLTYAPIHLFNSALEKHKQKFWHGILVFASYALPVIILGHIINLFQSSTYNSAIISTLALLVLALFIYLIVITIRNTKAYFSTTYAKASASVVLTGMIFLTISLIFYITLLVESLRGSFA